MFVHTYTYKVLHLEGWKYISDKLWYTEKYTFSCSISISKVIHFVGCAMGLTFFFINPSNTWQKKTYCANNITNIPGILCQHLSQDFIHTYIMTLWFIYKKKNFRHSSVIFVILIEKQCLGSGSAKSIRFWLPRLGSAKICRSKGQNINQILQ